MIALLVVTLRSNYPRFSSMLHLETSRWIEPKEGNIEEEIKVASFCQAHGHRIANINEGPNPAMFDLDNGP